LVHVYHYWYAIPYQYGTNGQWYNGMVLEYGNMAINKCLYFLCISSCFLFLR
jgi:hypothetical protein